MLLPTAITEAPEVRAYQLVPEQSTVAITGRHPQAKYFAARVAPRSTVAAR